MSKWTPGPWTFHTRRLPIAISHAPEMLLGVPSENSIGEAGIANARLLTASPEMADLLDRLQAAHLDATTINGLDVARLGALADEARALLSRIRGDE